MAYEGLLLDVKDGVALLTLNRPERLNAINGPTMASLFQAVDDLSKDTSVRVVVVTGAGRGFCAGGDLADPIPDDVLRRPKHSPRGIWVHRFMSLTVPTIAAINGVCVGGGLALALACDIRIAAESARFGAAFSRIGRTVIDGVSWLLPRAVGVGKSCEMLFTSEIISASEAKQLGLLNRVVADSELMPVTMDLAKRIAGGPPFAIQLIKQAIYHGLNRDLVPQLEYEGYAEELNAKVAGQDVEEGRRAFLEKREPKFKGLAP